jgi:hypothetical protein
LLRRCRPTNGPAAIAAWLDVHRRGQCPPFDGRCAPPPDLTGLRLALEQAAERLAEFGPIGGLYAERARELELEARLAERIGQPGFDRLARLRHAEGRGPEWLEARRLASAWAALPAAGLEARHASDDRDCPDSLLRVLAREIGRRRLPLRIEITAGLASRAACGDGVIFVSTGYWLSVGEARRVTAHEIVGHALPRLAARGHELGLLRVGSARSNDAEEGRAIHIEAAHGLLDDSRRRELGLRHTAALAVAGGADASECVARLRQFGCDVEEAITIYARVARGGGLCRELEYLPAWLRFVATSETEPEIAAWLARGRLSLAAARVLHAQGIHPGRAPGTFSTCHWQPTELPRVPT